MKHTIQEDNWRDEFNEKFVAHITSSAGNIEHDRAVIFFEDTVKIRDFISSLLASQLQSIIESLEEMKMKYYEDMSKEEQYKTDSLFIDFVGVDGYNKALSDVQSIISNRMGNKI